jgi:bifunctional non-homologous end joining protein LigD
MSERTERLNRCGKWSRSEKVFRESFDRIRYRHHDASVFLFAFDLIELNGDDLRRDPLVVRKAMLASLLSRASPGLRFNEHLDEKDGPLVFAHACKMGLEGIVSKRRDSFYRSGRSPDWIKSKNPNAPTVRREAAMRSCILALQRNSTPLAGQGCERHIVARSAKRLTRRLACWPLDRV